MILLNTMMRCVSVIISICHQFSAQVCSCYRVDAVRCPGGDDDLFWIYLAGSNWIVILLNSIISQLLLLKYRCRTLLVLCTNCQSRCSVVGRHLTDLMTPIFDYMSMINYYHPHCYQPVNVHDVRGWSFKRWREMLIGSLLNWPLVLMAAELRSLVRSTYDAYDVCSFRRLLIGNNSNR